MRSAGNTLNGHAVLAAASGLLLVTLLGCSVGRGSSEVTAVVFDGQSHTINGSVTCTTQFDGDLVIFVDGGSENTVRVLLRREHRIVAEKVGVRIGDLRGYTEDSANMWTTKVDDTYTINGRMPPNSGEATWHDFTIDAKCRNEIPQSYQRVPPRGAP